MRYLDPLGYMLVICFGTLNPYGIVLPCGHIPSDAQPGYNKKNVHLSMHPGSFEVAEPRGSRYQIIMDLGPKSHNNHGL